MPQNRGRIGDIRRLWKLCRRDPDGSDPELGSFSEYGLSFDYVARGTFGESQRRGYFRWQLSWGGPSDEFRFYTDEEFEPVEIEYWFLDWFDGSHLQLSGRDYDLLAEIFADWKDIGLVEVEYQKGKER